MKIVKYPHPALRHVSRPLLAIDNTVRRYAAEMLDLMYLHHGLGLAGNQVALPFQLLVMNEAGDPEKKEFERVCINPIILERKGTMDGDEGCLSFPELFQKVRRARTIRVQYYTLEGQLVEMECSEMPARVLQHEIDHLEGVLYIDRMGPIARLAARSSLRTFEREFQKLQERGEIPADADLKRALAELEAQAEAQAQQPAPQPQM